MVTVAVGCTSETPEPGAAGTWVGTIKTEGNVTTVVNESGSVWGGTARLVEEASIGVDAGENAYMFGYIHGIYATDDEIFILDQGSRGRADAERAFRTSPHLGGGVVGSDRRRRFR